MHGQKMMRQETHCFGLIGELESMVNAGVSIKALRKVVKQIQATTGDSVLASNWSYNLTTCDGNLTLEKTNEDQMNVRRSGCHQVQ